MFRSLIIPAIIVGALMFPFMVPIDQPDQNRFNTSGVVQSPPNALPYAPIGSGQSPFRATAAQLPTGGGLAPSAFRTAATPVTDFRNLATQRGSQAVPTLPTAVDDSWAGPILDENGNVVGVVPGPSGNVVGGAAPGQVLRADFGAAQNFTLPGTAAGPDFSAQPLQFTPVINFAEIFNFQVTSAWLQSRWDRVSNAPQSDGLRGQRVALVTGTNSWDLHGSLTYFFDEYQKCRRITFRGWTGDSSRLVDFLQANYRFKQQPTRWAGYYVSKSWRRSLGGLLMKNPPVTYADNRVQRMGILLEINDPDGNLSLSNDFETLIEGARPR